MSDKSIENNLDVLVLLSEALTKPSSLEEALRTITELTCQLMDTTQAAFLMADEAKQLFIVRSPIGLEEANLRDGVPLVVPDRLQNILWRLRSLHQVNWLDSGLEGIHFPIITMPIYFKGRRIGHLITAGARDPSKAKDPIRRKLFALIAPYASLIFENAKATELLSQRFAMHSQELLNEATKESADGGQETPAEQLLVTSVQNPGKVARLLAESFYRELATAGFTPGQITVAAAQILDCIVQNAPKGAQK